MITVEEFLEKHNLPETLSGGTLKWAMIEFAKEMEKEKKQLVIGNSTTSTANSYPQGTTITNL
jgi:hypothetical protein